MTRTARGPIALKAINVAIGAKDEVKEVSPATKKLWISWCQAIFDTPFKDVKKQKKKVTGNQDTKLEGLTLAKETASGEFDNFVGFFNSILTQVGSAMQIVYDAQATNLGPLQMQAVSDATNLGMDLGTVNALFLKLQGLQTTNNPLTTQAEWSQVEGLAKLVQADAKLKKIRSMKNIWQNTARTVSRRTRRPHRRRAAQRRWASNISKTSQPGWG
jgi:hypothetical protein